MLPRDQYLANARAKVSSSEISRFDETSERAWQDTAIKKIIRVLELHEWTNALKLRSRLTENDTSQFRDEVFRELVPFPYHFVAKRQYSLQLDKDKKSSFPRLLMTPWASPLFQFYKEEHDRYPREKSATPLLLCVYRANLPGGLAVHADAGLASSSTFGSLLRAAPTEDFPLPVFVQPFDHFLNDMKKYYSYGVS